MAPKRDTFTFSWQTSWPLLVLVIFVIVSRWYLKSQHLFHHDSVQFALALQHWDILQHQPHPPGYILYIGLAKAINLVIPDVNLAFIVLNIIATLVGLWAISWLATKWWGRTAGLIAGLLFAANASIWFHGLVAEVYLVELAVSLGVAILAFRCWQRPTSKLLIWLGLGLGLLGGVRQLGELALLPLVGYVIWSHYRFNWSHWWRFLAGLVVGNLLWLIPLLILSGGLGAYWQAVTALWDSTVMGYYASYRWVVLVKNFSLLIQTIKQSSPLIFAVLGLGLLPYLAKESQAHFQINRSKLMFWLWWIIPSLVLLSVGLMTNPGYALIIVTILVLLASGAITTFGVVVSRWQPTWSRWVVFGSVIIVALAQIGSFLAAPVLGLEYASASLTTVRQIDRNLNFLVESVGQGRMLPSDTTILVDGGYLLGGFRHLQYYLPSFHVYGWYPSGWPGLSQPDEQFVHVQGTTIFDSVAKLDIPAETTRIVALFSEPSRSPLPDMATYLSNFATGIDEYYLAYFDLADDRTKTFLDNSGYFNFLTIPNEAS